jgi:hypothetical protein
MNSFGASFQMWMLNKGEDLFSTPKSPGGSGKRITAVAPHGKL